MEESLNAIHIPIPLIIGMIITPFAKEPTSIEEVVVRMG
jgi:hypothetical protein